MTIPEMIVKYAKNMRIRVHVKRTAVMFALPDIKPPSKIKVGGLRKARHFMRGRWKGFIGGGILIGSAFATGGLSVGLQAVGGTLLLGEAGHELGRQTTKYGDKGTFGLAEILSLIIDLLSCIIAAFTKKEKIL